MSCRIASKYEKNARDNDKGSEFVPKSVLEEQAISRDSAFVPTQRQRVARAPSSEIDTEKNTITQTQSENWRECAISPRTTYNFSSDTRDTAETNSGDEDGGEGDAERNANVDQLHRPGAFAVVGIGGGSGNNTWESTLHIRDVEDCDSPLKEDSEHYVVEALNDKTLRDHFYSDIMNEAVHADQVVVVDDDKEKARQRTCGLYYIFALLTVLVLVIGLSVGLTRKKYRNIQPPTAIPTALPATLFPGASPTQVITRPLIPTLETIENNGKLRCGYGYFEDIEKDMCRALAAAVLGDPGKVDLVKTTFTARWKALDRQSLDVVTIVTTPTVARDVYQKDAKVGFTFSSPFLFDGLVFGGIPEYVDCADRLDAFFGNCHNVRICVKLGDTFHGILLDNVADLKIRAVPAGDSLFELLTKGECNVITGSSGAIQEAFSRKEGYTGDYKVGETIVVIEGLTMVTREDDKQWSDFVNWVFRSLVAAEEQNITSSTASKFMTTTVFGDKYKDMFVNAIQSVGNYGDIYRRHMERIIPRDSLKPNMLNNGSTGLHFAHLLGNPNKSSPDPIAGSTMHSITKEEGKLRCGIFAREGFGMKYISTTGTRWQGMDADYCYALSASLFEGDIDKVVFVNLTNYADGFQALENGLVDVVAGVPLTLERDVKEITTGKGYTFSIPYFYGDKSGTLLQDNESKTPQGALSLVTREDDSQWSDFVFWIVSATFIAEDQFITQKISEDMMGVPAFGPSFINMHRHAIGAAGNYAEIYTRNVESMLPRQGRNVLNTNPFEAQQFSFF